MNYIVVVRSIHIYPEDNLGYEITSIRCNTRKAAETIVDWLTVETKGAVDSYVHCLILKDAIP